MTATDQSFAEMSTTDPQATALSPAATPTPAKKASRFGRALTSTSRLLDSQFVGPDQAGFWEDNGEQNDSETDDFDTANGTPVSGQLASPPSEQPRDHPGFSEAPLEFQHYTPVTPGPGFVRKASVSTFTPETFTKEYVDAHPTELYHHVGHGRYKPGSRPSKPSKPVTLPPKRSLIVVLPVKFVPDSNRTPILLSEPKKLVNTNFNKAYVQAHPQEVFHHVGGGRYRPGPRPAGFYGPPKVAPAKASHKDANVDKEYVETHPLEVFHHVGYGRYRPGPKPVGPSIAMPSGTLGAASSDGLVVPAPEPVSGSGRPVRSSSMQQRTLHTDAIDRLVRDISPSGRVPSYWPSSPYLSQAPAFDKGKERVNDDQQQTLDNGMAFPDDFTGDDNYDPDQQAPDDEDDEFEATFDIEPEQADGWEEEGRPKRKYKSRKKQAPLPGSGPPLLQSSKPSTQPGIKRKRSPSVTSSLGDVVIAIALVKMLCGGLSQRSLNWDIVAHILSFRDDGEQLQLLWRRHSKFANRDLEQMHTAMREPFLAAYERGELGRIDFQNLSNTDWPALFAWWKAQNIRPTLSAAATTTLPCVTLPESTLAVRERFLVTESDYRGLTDSETFFTANTDIQRNSTAVRILQGRTLEDPQTNGPPQNQDDDLMLLKSWCRAVAVTKPANYNARTAATRLGIFPNDLIQRATDDLLTTGFLGIEKKGRQHPGRNFYPSIKTLKLFQRWPPSPAPDAPSFLRQVADARADIIEHLQVHETAELSHHAPDAEVLVFTNMVAQGHLKAHTILPQRNDDFEAPWPRLSAWGFGDAENMYNSAHYDTKRMRFPIVYHRTPTFRGAEHGLRCDVPVPVTLPIVGDEQGMRTPFWVDIHGNLIGDIWEMVLQSLLNLVVFRSGITAQGIANAHEEKMWVWELQLILRWMEEVGLAVRCGRGREVEGMWQGGWRAGEWWYCAFVPDIAVWEVAK